VSARSSACVCDVSAFSTFGHDRSWRDKNTARQMTWLAPLVSRRISGTSTQVFRGRHLVLIFYASSTSAPPVPPSLSPGTPVRMPYWPSGAIWGPVSVSGYRGACWGVQGLSGENLADRGAMGNQAGVSRSAALAVIGASENKKGRDLPAVYRFVDLGSALFGHALHGFSFASSSS
jgi:hypothetical protein